jgi:hypothetical protein
LTSNSFCVRSKISIARRRCTISVSTLSISKPAAQCWRSSVSGDAFYDDRTRRSDREER